MSSNPPERDDDALVTSRVVDKSVLAQAKSATHVSGEAIDDAWLQADPSVASGSSANETTRQGAETRPSDARPSSPPRPPEVPPSQSSLDRGPYGRRPSTPPESRRVSGSERSERGASPSQPPPEASWSSAHGLTDSTQSRSRRHLLEGIALCARTMGLDNDLGAPPHGHPSGELGEILPMASERRGLRSEPAPPIDVSEDLSNSFPSAVERTPPGRIGLIAAVGTGAVLAAVWAVTRPNQPVGPVRMTSAIDHASMILGHRSTASPTGRSSQRPTPASADPASSVRATTACGADSLGGGPAPSPGAASEEAVTVLLDVLPAGASIFRQGKPIGKSPLTVVLAPDERREYEAVKSGYVTRRISVDGSRAVVSLRMAKTPPAGTEVADE